MTKSPSLRPSPAAPSQVWERLEAEQQHRALQLLAQMALHFITADAQASHTEDSLCSPSNDSQSYALTILPVRH
jgi:hypothetical protein